MVSASSRPVLTSLASAGFALLAACLFLALRGVWPFGGHFLEYMDNGQMAVSYTHLTLPTICSV